MEEIRRAAQSEARRDEPVLSERIKASLDRTFDQHLSSDPPAETSFEEVVAMLVENRKLIPLARRYVVDEAWWARHDVDASESAENKLAWALVEKFAKVQT